MRAGDIPALAFSGEQVLASRACDAASVGTLRAMPYRFVDHSEVISPALVTTGSNMRNESCIEYAFDVSVLRSK